MGPRTECAPVDHNEFHRGLTHPHSLGIVQPCLLAFHFGVFVVFVVSSHFSTTDSLLITYNV